MVPGRRGPRRHRGDLGDHRPSSTAHQGQDAASQNASIKEINADLADCAFAVKESFHFYNLNVAGKLTSSDLAQVPTLLTGDETACSFASEPVYDLTNNLQVDDTAAGKHIDRMLSVVERWITDYALASIEDIQYLFIHPGDATTIRHLGNQELGLANERQKALADEATAERVLGVTLHAVKIPSLPHLSRHLTVLGIGRFDRSVERTRAIVRCYE